jgi:hypothetical protein
MGELRILHNSVFATLSTYCTIIECFVSVSNETELKLKCIADIILQNYETYILIVFSGGA